MMKFSLIRLVPFGTSGSPVCEGSRREVCRAGVSLALSSLLYVRRFPDLEDMTSEERGVARAASIVSHEEVDEQRIQQVLSQLNMILRGLESPTYAVADSLDS